MNRNPAGGAEVPQPGGYQEANNATFGAGTTHPCKHDFDPARAQTTWDGKRMFRGAEPRCRYCYMTEAEAKEKP